MALRNMPEVVDNDFLMDLSNELTTLSWRKVARHLGMTEPIINSIYSQNHGNQYEIYYQMFQKWKEVTGSGATYKVLEVALKNAQRLDLSELVIKEANKLRQPSGTVPKKTEDQEQNYGGNSPPCKRVKTSHEDTSSVLPSHIKEIFDSFIEDLKKTYQRLAKKVRPVPYSNVSCCVGDIFVESNLEEMKQTLFELAEWKPVDSYYDIVCDDANRLLLDGEPGFGKSTLALQMAYEWCRTLDGCPMNEIDIFILIRLRDVRDVISIFRVIKLFLLPKNTKLEEGDIEKILSISHLRIVFIMEGFDEFTLAGKDCDVSSIIKGDMYPDRKVVITTRPDCTQSLLRFVDRRMRLKGFDERIQDTYIKKVVFHSESDKRKKEVIKVFRENDLLADISQVPLLFVMLAHLLKEKPELEKQQSITAFYSYMIKCFRGHKENRGPSGLKGSRGLSKQDQQLELKVSKVAFKGLVSKRQTLEWDKDTLVNALGDDGYKQYKHIGILVEEEVLKDYQTKGQLVHHEVVNRVKLRFFHKTFQEYYAALYLANLMKDKDGTKINEYLENLNPKDVVYFFLFTCGLDDNVANFVLDFLLNVEKRHGHRLGLKPSILSVKEIGNVDKLKECISKVCAEGITIETANSTRHLQRASFELIQTASKHEIPVKVIQLDDLFVSVNTRTGNIDTIIGLHLPRLRFVKRLHLRDNGREWTGDEFQDILLYASSCNGLECITFSNCMVPLDVNDSTALPNGISTKISVRWNSPHYNIVPYELNLDPFRWEVRRGSTVRPVSGFQEELLLQSEYELLENEFRRLYRDSKWQKTHISTHPDNRNCVEDETLSKLSCEIKNEWRAFAARLRISKIWINAISSDSTDNTPQDEAYKMLREWKILMKEHASPYVLERALRGASKDNLIDKLYHGGPLPDSIQALKGRNATAKILPNNGSVEGIQSHKVKMVVSKKGGTVTLGGTGVKLYIPRGAFHDRHKIRMRILPHYLFDEPATSFEDHTTLMVDISPYDLRLQEPASLFLPHCLKLTNLENLDVQVYNCYSKPDQKPLWKDVTKSVSFSLSEFGCTIEIERFCSVKYTVRGEGLEAKKLKLYAMGEKCNENAEHVTVNIGCHPDLPGENKVFRETFREKFQGDSQTFLFFKKPCFDLNISCVGTLPVWNSQVTRIPMKLPYSWVESSVAETCSFSFQRPRPCATLPRCVFEISGNPVQPKYRLTVNFRSLQPPTAEKTVVTDDALFTLSHQIQDVWEDIGRRLQVPETDLNNTLNEKSSGQEKAHKMLIAWKRRVGQVAFAEVLEGVLVDEHKHDLIDELRKAMQVPVSDNHVQSVDPREKHSLEASAVISQAGGVVQINDTGVELHIPPDAFQGFITLGHTIQLRILPHHIYDGQAKRFEDHSTVMVEVLPNDLELKRSARLFLPHCLKLTSAIHSEVRIFKSHHNADQKPLWEDITTSVTFSLSRSYCEIRIKRFCWIKYTIRGQVEAKTLKVYTKVKKSEENAGFVTVEVGCHPNLPGGNKVLKDSDASGANVCGDVRDFCFLKEPQNDLHISLAKCPAGWISSDPPRHKMIIPYRAIQNSKQTNCHFLFKWDGRTSFFAWCDFEVFQDKHQLLTHLTFTFEPLLPNPSVLEQRLVTDSQLSLLSAMIGMEWQYIARYLQIPEDRLFLIESNAHLHREQVYQMLSTWKLQHGQSATTDILARALGNSGRRDLEGIITEKTHQPGSGWSGMILQDIIFKYPGKLYSV